MRAYIEIIDIKDEDLDEFVFTDGDEDPETAMLVPAVNVPHEPKFGPGKDLGTTPEEPYDAAPTEELTLGYTEVEWTY